MNNQHYKCKRCLRTIKKATYLRYGGYSAQCLKKVHEKEHQLEQSIIDYNDYDYYVEKALSLNIAPRFKTRDEFNYIWGIKNPQSGYYERYLDNTIGSLLGDSFLAPITAVTN
jgi:hypothetical protein